MHIKSKFDYDYLVSTLKKSGNEVNETYEDVGKKVVFKGTSGRIKEIFDISDEFERNFIEAITQFKPKNIGPYITEKYFMLIPGLKEAMGQLKSDCKETRRCIMQFPPAHCFQSMQFLLRENTIHVVCYMRSCNVIKNLPHDLWICSKMADIFAKYLEDTTGEHPYPYHSITMMFGSLHVFKDEVKDVF